MPDLTISIRRRTLSDRSDVYDLEIRQHDQIITIPCYGRQETEQLKATLVSVIQATACLNIVLI